MTTRNWLRKENSSVNPAVELRPAIIISVPQRNCSEITPMLFFQGLHPEGAKDDFPNGGGYALQGGVR